MKTILSCFRFRVRLPRANSSPVVPPVTTCDVTYTDDTCVDYTDGTFAEYI